MPLRDVTLNYQLAERVGDETYELWLRTGTSWALVQTGAVEQVDPSQDFLIADLEEGTPYVAQLRFVREGRYRTDYLAGNPDSWPNQSRVAFEPGLSEELGIPTIAGAPTWARTGASAQGVTVNADADTGSEAYAIQLLRNGVVVDEVAGPHVGTVELFDADPPIATLHAYTVRHAVGLQVGTQSAPANRWTGPDAPTGLVESHVATWYNYSLDWDTPPSGAVTRVQDDYLSVGIFANRGSVTAEDATTFAATLEKNSALDPNGNIPCYLQARARHEVTAFTVTDVSQWAGPIEVATEIASDETAWDARPAP